MNLLLILLVTLILSAFFSGMEIAYLSANKLRLELDKQSDPFNSRLLRIVTKNPAQYIATMLVGNNIVLVIFGISFTMLADSLLDINPDSFFTLLIQTLISAIIILLLAEFLPKTLFRLFPNTLLKFLSLPLSFFYFIFYPISKFVIGISNLLLKKIFRMKVNKNSASLVFSKIDLDDFISEQEKRIALRDESVEKEVILFRNVLDFSRVKLREIMIPRTEIEAVDISSDPEDIKQKFIEAGYSRILLYDGNIDNMVGYLHSSSVFSFPESARTQLNDLIIVPESMSASKLFKLFIQGNRNMALVVDEFGGTSGLVTIEDILEEIFGEIEDEHDSSDYIEKKISESEFILSGRIEIDDLNEKYGLELPESENFETLAGLILYYHESIPKINSIIDIGNFNFKILKATSTKIELVKLTLKNE